MPLTIDKIAKKQDPKNPTAHFQVFHPAGLLFNNSLPLEQSRILPITHIDLGDTHLGSFATNIVLNDAILRLILISTPKIARGSEVILQSSYYGSLPSWDLCLPYPCNSSTIDKPARSSPLLRLAKPSGLSNGTRPSYYYRYGST